MTNILQLPLFEVVIETHSNERARTSFHVQTGTPAADLSLVGISFRFQLRSALGNKNVHLEGSTADGRLIVSGATLAFDIPRAVMQGLGPLDYLFDLLAEGDSIQRRFMYGVWRHRLGVTRS